ncbi:unnamed protein product [Ectocarpus sp. CCAP 1310/34]|nr:unnamed protein product [Ectocarpus sp. CCAP 1310/34]
MIPRVLGFIVCGACAASAFVAPSVLRSQQQHGDTPSRYSSRSSSVGHRREAMSMGGEPQSRRNVIAGKGVGKSVAAAVGVTTLASASVPDEAAAFGPIKMELTEPEYASVVCPPKTQVPGEKAGAGLKPVCVKVTVTANNPSPKEVVDAAVFGFVFDEDSTSVVANNPDGASDAGQFAIIDKIPKGSSRVSFQFVAAIEPDEDFSLKKLKFKSLKAISYAGGQQYGAITECEMNPLAAECDFD